jgi:hypothetical protein
LRNLCAIMPAEPGIFGNVRGILGCRAGGIFAQPMRNNGWEPRILRNVRAIMGSSALLRRVVQKTGA